MTRFTGSIVEEAPLAWLFARGPDIAPDMPAAERLDDHNAALRERLRDTLLPTLISGELRVQDAERIIGRTV